MFHLNYFLNEIDNKVAYYGDNDVTSYVKMPYF